MVQAQQPQARGRAYRLLASALSSEGDTRSGKLSYGDVTEFWIQKLELPDPQEIDKEYEELKQSLRVALAPERLMILLQEISKYRGERIVVLTSDKRYTMCKKVFDDLETENILPCWMHLSCEFKWTGRGTEPETYGEFELTISPNKVPGRTMLSDYGYGHKSSILS